MNFYLIIFFNINVLIFNFNIHHIVFHNRDLSSNKIIGSIPSSIGKLSKLKFL